MIIAGTGTRSIATDSAVMEWMIARLVGLITRGRSEGIDLTLISGMAEGFDSAVALAAIQCDVPFKAYVPHSTYGSYYWGKHSLTGTDRLSEFKAILANASEVVTVSKTIYVNGVHANFVRNIAMVDAADKVWCYDPESRGTYHTVQYARKVGTPVYEIPLHTGV